MSGREVPSSLIRITPLRLRNHGFLRSDHTKVDMAVMSAASAINAGGSRINMETSESNEATVPALFHVGKVNFA